MNALRSLTERGDAPVVYVFAHAGGAVNEYRTLARHALELTWTGVQLRGRPGRFSEPALETVPAIVADVLPAIVADVERHGRPYGLFGHSFGALVAFETSRRLVAGPSRPPSHLWVSAFPAPDRIPATPALGDATDHELLELLNDRFGAIPDEVRQHEELAAIVAGYIRSDYRALESYEPPTPEVLHLDMTAYTGTTDGERPAEVLEWRRWCGRSFTFQALPGGHFYLYDPPNASRLARDISLALATTKEPA